VFTSPGVVAVKVQTVGTITEFPKKPTFLPLKIILEISSGALVTQLIKKTLKELVRLTKNVTHYVSAKFS